MRALLVVILASVFAVLPAQEPLLAPSPPLLIKVGRVIPVEGPPIEGADILVKDGRIAAIGKIEVVPKDTITIAWPDGIAFPGFVDAGGYLGAVAHKDEATRAVMPHLRMADALEATDPSIAKAVAAGITTFHLMPGDSDVIGGQSAVVKVSPEGTVTWLRKVAFLKVSLAASSWDKSTPPTHLLGGLERLAELKNQDAVKPFWAERCVVSAATSAEIDAVTGLNDQLGMNPLLLASSAVVEHADRLKDHVRGVLLNPLRPDLGDHWRRAAARLADAGVPFAFASQAPRSPVESLRLSAVTARMAGLSREAAWRALTLDAARLLGVEQRVGSLKVGKDADILIMTREPSDPRARMLFVVQDGRVVNKPWEDKETR